MAWISRAKAATVASAADQSRNFHTDPVLQNANPGDGTAALGIRQKSLATGAF